MSIFQIPDVAEIEMLNKLTADDILLKLYSNDVETGLSETQIAALTVSDFTEATFTGYSDVTLTGGSWTVTSGAPSIAEYASQTFASTADQTPQQVYGYYMVHPATGELAGYKQYNGSITIEFDGDGVNITPSLHLSNKEDLMPVGSISMYGGPNYPPAGYLACEGGGFSRTTYAELFNVIGTWYGAGDGSTTFNVPDYRQTFPMGVADIGTGDNLAVSGGSIDHDHSLAIDDGATGFARVLSLAEGAIGYDQNGTTSWTYDTKFTPSGGGTKAASSAGVSSGSGLDGDTAKSNPPFLTCYFIIKY